MGCQTSKAANPSTQVPTHLSKTLLESGDTEKVASHAEVNQIGVSAAKTVDTSAAPGDKIVDLSETQAPASPTDEAPLAVVDHVSTSSQAPAFGIHDATITDSTHNQGMLRKQLTRTTDRNELDIMVVEFTSHDSTVGSVIGRHSKEMHWKVMYDLSAPPIDIKLNVQEHKLHSNEVSIESNGQMLFQGAGAHAKAKMTEDFKCQWPLRATIKGINEVDFYEFHPDHSASGRWFPATITAQRQDGFFEVRAKEMDANGCITEVVYPAVHAGSLREAASGTTLIVPEDFLMLEVPQHDPLHALLHVANGDLVTRRFGRPSPPHNKLQKPEIIFKVSKDRRWVVANVGHSVLSHFVSGEVQAVSCDMQRLKHSWTVQIGPFAEHTIQIVKKHTVGKIVTLLIDGEVLVESTNTDIFCQGKEWNCNFRFVGERVLDFEVYKTNADGAPTDATDRVKERRKYVHECSVVIPNEWDLTTAQFFIDGTPFNQLAMKAEPHKEPNLKVDPLALLHSYGITTPYKVDKTAPSNIMVLANQVFSSASDSSKVAGGFFARCCDCRTVVAEELKHIAKPSNE